MRGDSIDHQRSMLSIQSPKPKYHSPEMVNVSGGIEFKMRLWCGYGEQTGGCQGEGGLGEGWSGKLGLADVSYYIQNG